MTANTVIEKEPERWRSCFMASTGVRAYNDLGAVPPGGPVAGGVRAKPFAPKLKAFLQCRRLIFVLKCCAHEKIVLGYVLWCRPDCTNSPDCVCSRVSAPDPAGGLNDLPW